MIRLIFIKILFFTNLIYAMECQKRLFDININEDLSIEESLKELASYCSFSVVIKDTIAKEKLKAIQSSINIHQMSLDEIVGGKIKCRKRKIKCRIFATNYLSFNLKLKL
ncbi:hypothetical protein CDB59_08700 [Campylobacter coli]|nr:hypothetical protein [Campylobacter coli]